MRHETASFGGWLTHVFANKSEHLKVSGGTSKDRGSHRQLSRPGPLLPSDVSRASVVCAVSSLVGAARTRPPRTIAPPTRIAPGVSLALALPSSHTGECHVPARLHMSQAPTRRRPASLTRTLSLSLSRMHANAWHARTWTSSRHHLPRRRRRRMQCTLHPPPLITRAHACLSLSRWTRKRAHVAANKHDAMLHPQVRQRLHTPAPNPGVVSPRQWPPTLTSIASPAAGSGAAAAVAAAALEAS